MLVSLSCFELDVLRYMWGLVRDEESVRLAKPTDDCSSLAGQPPLPFFFARGREGESGLSGLKSLASWNVHYWNVTL